MKKIIYIFLLLPIMCICQERSFEKVISLSRFVDELQFASKAGIDYDLEDCLITFDSIIDSEYISYEDSIDKVFMYDAIVSGIHFNYGTSVNLVNCLFGNELDLLNGYYPTLKFLDCKFSFLTIVSDTVYKQKILFSSNKIDRLSLEKIYCEVVDSQIKYLHINGGNEIVKYRPYSYSGITSFSIEHNTIDVFSLSSIDVINNRHLNYIAFQQTTYTFISRKLHTLLFPANYMHFYFQQTTYTFISSKLNTSKDRVRDKLVQVHLRLEHLSVPHIIH